MTLGQSHSSHHCGSACGPENAHGGLESAHGGPESARGGTESAHGGTESAHGGPATGCASRHDLGCRTSDGANPGRHRYQSDGGCSVEESDGRDRSGHLVDHGPATGASVSGRMVSVGDGGCSAAGPDGRTWRTVRRSVRRMGVRGSSVSSATG